MQSLPVNTAGDTLLKYEALNFPFYTTNIEQHPSTHKQSIILTVI